MKVCYKEAAEALEVYDLAMSYVDWAEAKHEVSYQEVVGAQAVLREVVAYCDPIEAQAIEFAEILRDM